MSGTARATVGLILCGGAGTRMGGADKPLLAWQNSTLLDSVVRRLTPQVDELVISANRNIEAYQRRSTVVTDQWPDYQGPLAGLASVLLHYRSLDASLSDPLLDAQRRYLVCPGDMPLLPYDLGQRLALGYQPGQPRYVHDGNRPQPLCLLCDDSVLAGLQRYLHSSKRSVLGWLEQCRAVPVTFSAPAAFANFNTLEQLRQGD